MTRSHFSLMAAALSAVLMAGPAMADERGDRVPPVSEVRLGVAAHDQGIFSSKKEDGVDINAEVLFRDVGGFGSGVLLRPHLGLTANTAGDTSQVYAGLSGTFRIFGRGFIEVSVGGAVHNGNTDENEIGRKDLGCKVLFRESVSLGAFITEHSSVSVYADHISNANICSKNEGLETVGVRYGYRF